MVCGCLIGLMFGVVSWILVWGERMENGLAGFCCVDVVEILFRSRVERDRRCVRLSMCGYCCDKYGEKRVKCVER